MCIVFLECSLSQLMFQKSKYIVKGTQYLLSQASLCGTNRPTTGIALVFQMFLTHKATYKRPANGLTWSNFNRAITHTVQQCISPAEKTVKIVAVLQFFYLVYSPAENKTHVPEFVQ